MNKYRQGLLKLHRSKEWDSTHGCFSVSKLVKMFNVKVMAEIGVCLGHTATEVLEHNKITRYYMVDNWKNENSYRAVAHNFKENNITIIRKDSMSALKDFEDESLDLVLIDAGHTYERTAEDIHGWIKKVKHGGILIGDGFNDPKDSHYGVNQAVFEIFRKDEINIDYGPAANYWVYKP